MKTKITKLLILGLLMGGLNQLSAQNYNVNSCKQYLGEQNYEEAKDAIDKAAKNSKTSNDAEMWLYKGIIYLNIHSSQDSATKALDLNAALISAESFKKFYASGDKTEDDVKLANNYVGYAAYYSIIEGASLGKVKKYDDAWKQYDLALELMKLDDKGMQLIKTKMSTNKIDIYKQMYVTANNAKDLKRQKFMIDLFKEANFNDPLYYKLNSEYYLNSGDTASAKATLKEGREVFEDDKELLMTEINLFIETGESAKMLANISKAIELEPDNPKYYYIRGVLEDENKQYLKSEASYKKALELDPGMYNASFNLASLYVNNAKRAIKIEGKSFTEIETIQKGYYEKAIPLLKTCNAADVQDDNERLQILRSLAKIHFNLNKSVQGKAYRDQYKALKKKIGNSKL